MLVSRLKICRECNRQFDMSIDDDADEWYAGHDCEVPSHIHIDAEPIEEDLHDDLGYEIYSD